MTHSIGLHDLTLLHYRIHLEGSFLMSDKFPLFGNQNTAEQVDVNALYIPALVVEFCQKEEMPMHNIILLYFIQMELEQKKNEQKAVELYHKAAERGHVNARTVCKEIIGKKIAYTKNRITFPKLNQIA